MLTAQTPDVDRLQASDTAVVLDLHSGKIPQRIGYRIGAQALKLPSRKPLRRHYFPYPVRSNHHLVQRIHRHVLSLVPDLVLALCHALSILLRVVQNLALCHALSP